MTLFTSARFKRGALVALFIGAPLAAVGQAALDTAFTHQGQLQQNGAPLNNTADFEFRLFDAPSGGAQMGSTLPVSDVDVVNGLFTPCWTSAQVPSTATSAGCKSPCAAPPAEETSPRCHHVSRSW